jgi:hypothetical protein
VISVGLTVGYFSLPRCPAASTSPIIAGGVVVGLGGAMTTPGVEPGIWGRRAWLAPLFKSQRHIPWLAVLAKNAF